MAAIPVSSEYKVALEQARKDLAAALDRRDERERDVQKANDEMRRLRSLILSLSQLLGEPSPELPMEPLSKRTKKARGGR